MEEEPVVFAPGTYQTETSDMIAVHEALIEALDAAPILVASTRDDPDRVRTIGSYYENVLEFLHVHHAGEDELIFPLLEERCVAEQEMLRRIDAQHHLLDEPIAEAKAAIGAWLSDPSVEGGESVTELIGVISDVLRPHLGEEETMVLPVASAWISPEEWAVLPGHALRSFRGDKPWLALGLVRERLAPDRQEQMLARMPPELQALWLEQWEPTFTTFMGEVRSL